MRPVSQLMVVGALALTAPAAGAQDVRAAVGQPAQRFALELLNGGRLDLADLRGRPVVINFWATWCLPCRTEMPLLVSTWHAHRGDDMEILAVNLADQERRKDIVRFVDRLAPPFPVVLDQRGAVRELYGLVSLPTTVFVDSGGTVRSVHAGPLSSADLADGLATILPAVGPASRPGGPGR
jgi:thiol-disulfide isomerase/thioredoxin